MVTAFLPTFPIRADLALVQGDAYIRALGLRTSAGLVDTDGWVARLQVRKADGSLAVEASTDNGRITVGLQGTAPNQWNLLIDIPGLVTATLADWGVGEWQLEAGPTSTTMVTYFGGKSWLVPDVAF